MTCAKCQKTLSLIELRCSRGLAGIRSVTTRYGCPNCPVELTVDNRVPPDAALWRFYQGRRRRQKWHLWIEERLFPTRARVSGASACGYCDMIAHPDRIMPPPKTREQVCQMCRCLADKFEIKLPKGARS